MGIDKNHKYYGHLYVKPRERKSIHVEGMEKAYAILNNLPYITQKKVILSLLRKSTKPMLAEARRNVRSVSEGTAKSIGNVELKGRRLGIAVKPRTKGKYKDYGHKAHWIEFGTSGIISKKGRKGWATKRNDDNPDFAKWVGKKKKGERYRIDTPPHPFMRPAIEKRRQDVLKLLKKLVAEDLDKTIKKFKK